MSEAVEERPELAQSFVERLTSVLGAFAGPATRMTLEDVARATHLPRSTAHRILDQLVQVSWLEHSSFGYSLGRGARALGGGDRAHDDLRAAVAPTLAELALATGMVVHLGVLVGAEVLCLDKVAGSSSALLPSRVGGRFPAPTTASGRAILAWLEVEEVAALVEDATPLLSPSQLDLNELHQDLYQVRGRSGLAYVRSTAYPGIDSVAAAIRGPEGPLGAISLSGRSGTSLERVAPLVLAAARQGSIDLFGGLQPARSRRAGRRSVS